MFRLRQTLDGQNLIESFLDDWLKPEPKPVTQSRSKKKTPSKGPKVTDLMRRRRYRGRKRELATLNR
jgi:hypothetical protein